MYTLVLCKWVFENQKIVKKKNAKKGYFSNLKNHLNIQNLEFVVLETICHQILPTASSSGGAF